VAVYERIVSEKYVFSEFQRFNTNIKKLKPLHRSELQQKEVLLSDRAF